MMRDRLVGLLVVLVLLAGAAWTATHTEWVTDTRWRGAKGEARDNPVFAFEQLLRHLGMTARHRDTLTELPPEGGRLVLLSDEWALMPERSAELQAWVKRGGHLILTQPSDWAETPLASWVPITTIHHKVPTIDADSAQCKAPRAAPSSPASSGTTSTRADGVVIHDEDADGDENGDENGDEVDDDADEDAGAADHSDADKGDEDGDEEDGRKVIKADAVPPLFGTVDRLRTCGLFYREDKLSVASGARSVWTLSTDQGEQALRLAVGQGSVTVMNLTHYDFSNDQVQACDHPLVLASAVQATPGATVWFYLNEQREPLLPWLWHQGWIAIVVAGLALAATLWRHAVRFGPRVAPAPRLRRSISEQVRGLGAYLQREGPDALLLAQQRALDDTAARHQPGYRRQTIPDRARWVADATGVDRHDLQAAMSARFCTRAELPGRLQVLETARRRLQAQHEMRAGGAGRASRDARGGQDAPGASEARPARGPLAAPDSPDLQDERHST